MKKNEKNKLLYDRFLHLARYILCVDEAAKIVAENAIKVIEKNYEKISADKSFIKESKIILDNEIENYFQAILEKIKSNSKGAEEVLYQILQKRFMSIDSLDMQPEDVEDVVQIALGTVLKKCKESKPKGTFIQWAQKILKHKYLDKKRIIIKNSNRSATLSQEKFEPVYTKKIGDFIKKKRSSEKPAERESTHPDMPDFSERKPFEEDPFDWQPLLLVECKNLKKHLLSIVKKMGERCKKVFDVLFAGGDVKAIHEKFPDLPKERVYVIVSRCRNQLKTIALERGILQ